MPKRKEDKSGYSIDGEDYASVTKIIGWVFNGGKSDRLVPWAVKVTCDYINASIHRLIDSPVGTYPEAVLEVIEDARKESIEIAQEASDIGEEVHKLISTEWVQRKRNDMDHGTNTTRDPLPPWVDERIVRAYGAFLDWAEKVDLAPVESELIVYDKKMRYAGTLDLVAFINTPTGRKLYIIDIKTSNYFYNIPNGCQLGAYHKAYGRRSYGKIDGIGVIRLDKATGKPHWKDYTEDLEKYKATFKMFREIYRIWKEKGGDQSE